MSDFFADQTSTVDVEFPDSGVTVRLKKFITAGIKEDVSNQMVRVQLMEEQGSANGKNAAAVREARLQTGDFFVLSKMIVAVIVPEGIPKPHVPVSNSFLGSLRPEVIQRLVNVVNEWNPLVEEATQETST